LAAVGIVLAMFANVVGPAENDSFRERATGSSKRRSELAVTAVRGGVAGAAAPVTVGSVDERVRLRSGGSLIGTAVGGHGRSDVGCDEETADAVEDVLPGQDAARHGHLLRGLSIDKGQLGWSAVGGDGSEDVAAFRLLRQREASVSERRKEVAGLHNELSDAAFGVEREGLDSLLKIEVGLKGVLLVEFFDDLVGVGVVGNESAGVAAEKIVEEAPLFGGRGVRVPEGSRASWIGKRSVMKRDLTEEQS